MSVSSSLSASPIPNVADLSNLFAELALIPSRNKAFTSLSNYLHKFGVASACFFEVSKGFLPDKPMVLFNDISDNGFGQSWIDNYAKKQFVKVDVLLKHLSNLPVWDNANKIRSKDTISRKITSEMSMYKLHEAIITSYITPTGTVGAVLLCSKAGALYSWPKAVTALMAELCKIVITKQPTRRDNKNKNIWPKPDTQSYLAYKILANGGSNQDLIDGLGVSQSTAEWHVAQCKNFLSNVYLQGDLEVISRGEIAGILYPLFGDKWELYR